MWTRYYSHGKLLLTGEYTVLDGSLSLALPTAFGQELKVRQQKTTRLDWTSLDEKEGVWFKKSFNPNDLEPVNTTDMDPGPVAHRLSTLLKKARELNPDFLKNESGFQVETRMDFDRHWGLGSSSTLVNNIAQWALVDPYLLQQSTFGGSGYDIACAIQGKPLLFHLDDQQPRVSEIDFNPPFKDQLFFVYLNRKQDSREGIERYRGLDIAKRELIGQITSITRNLTSCVHLTEFIELLEAHEILMAKSLELKRVQDELFPDYKGVIKSLGAWGGDFVLATSEHEGSAYFHKRGYHTVLSYRKMIL